MKNTSYAIFLILTALCCWGFSQLNIPHLVTDAGVVIIAMGLSTLRAIYLKKRGMYR